MNNKNQKIEFVCEQCGNVSIMRKCTLNNIFICQKCRQKNSLKNVNWNDRNLKTKNTHIERYGYYNVNTDKAKQTKLERYGDAHYNNQEKTKQTCLTKYGVEHVTQTDIYKEKTKQTCLSKYGVEHIAKLDSSKQRFINWITSDEFKRKSVETCLKKYGITNGGGSDMAHQKMHRKYTYNNLNFDSSWELYLYIFLTDNIIEFEYQPKISFEYKVDNKIHKYFPDFKIENDYIEIKGDHFFENNTMVNPFKRDIETDRLYNEKYNCMLNNNVTILKSSDLTDIIKYVDDKYGNNYIQSFRN